MPDSPLHKFHIPVMGLAFTIDSPIKVARFGAQLKLPDLASPPLYPSWKTG